MINGREAIGMPSHRIAHLGIGYCPEERGIFSSLSCEENLLLPPKVASTGMSVDEIYHMFPNLKERRMSQGSRLSGGEQQMLAVARILRTGAQLLLLDEISEGLAPVIVQALGANHPDAAREGLHYRDGGAEFPLRRAPGRPLLRDGARPHRRGLLGGRNAVKNGNAARIPGHLIFNVLMEEIYMKRKLLATLVGTALLGMARTLCLPRPPNPVRSPEIKSLSAS